MTQLSACPDREHLARLLDPGTRENDAGPLEEHLLSCDRCCEALHELEAADTLVEPMRGTRLELPADEAVQKAIVRLKAVSMPQAALDETLGSKCESTDDAWGLENLLDPPRSQGELGYFAGYRVLRVLGAGGMGIVFDAEDPHLLRHVALKVMKPRLASNAEQHKRFLREARAAAAIEHAHIVPVYQVGEHRGLPYLVMQLLKGESLDSRLRRCSAGNAEGAVAPAPGRHDKETSGQGDKENEVIANRKLQIANWPLKDRGEDNPKSKIENPKSALPLAEALRIGRETAEALAVAHERGLIHRDIKPGNIWLEAPSGWVKLLDFGLAHAVEDEVHLTQTGTILGTPAYMSPEQARGDRVGPRSDLFSLGAVLYRLTTGKQPFQGPSTLAVLTALAVERPKPPRELNPEIPIALSELIERLLAKHPDERFDSAEAVVEALRAIEAELVERNSFRSDSCSPKTQKRNEFRSTTGRWPLVVAAAAAAAFVLATIVIIVRDKDGNETARLEVPQGSMVDIVDDDQTSQPKAANRRKPPGNAISADSNASGTNNPQTLADVPAPVATSEPPPLDEWLQGRKVLTVAQDGSGQFKTIQAALDALQPGQVVEMLDHGPYRESLVFRQQKNVGLFSRTGTVVLSGGTRKPEFKDDRAESSNFAFIDGFRMSGISFVANTNDLREMPADAPWLLFGLNGDAVIENCRFTYTSPDQPDVAPEAAWVLVYWRPEAAPEATCTVRDCLFDIKLNFNALEPRRPVAVIERNWFRPSPQYFSLYVHGPAQRIVLRHNVFDVQGKGALGFRDVGTMGRLEIYNNTILGRVNFGASDPARDNLGMPMTGLIRNNLFQQPIECEAADESSLARAAENWQIGNNEYEEKAATPGQLASTKSDFTGEPKFLATTSDARDYLRIAADSEEAHRGAGGEWPSYLGALPPGRAPIEGDWFTRLQQR
ncbi:MAG TPA: protein kinase [Pirellulales bacterium]|nr:protein kinase [Pirellulales bacterium]